MSKKNSIAKNSLFNISYKVFGVLFPLVSQAYIARALMPEQIGLIAFAQNVVSYFTFLAPLGIAQYGVRQIATNRNDKSCLNKIFTELFLINAVSTLIFTILYYIMILSFSYFNENRYLYLIFGLNIFFHLFNVDWFYMGIERFDYIATRSIIIKIISFLGLIVLVKKPSDYIIYAIITVVALCGNYFISFLALHKHIDFYKGSLLFRNHLKPLIVLLSSSIAAELYTMLDSTMIRIIKGDVELAYYSTSSKIIKISFAILSALFSTFFPRLSSLWKDDKRKYKEFLLIETNIAWYLSIPCSVGIFMCSKEIIVSIFSQKYISSIGTLQIFSPLLIIFSFAYVHGHIPLLIYGKENKILHATIIAAIENVVLNLILIPILGKDGAAVASVIAELSVTIILLYNANKEYKILMDLNSIVKTIISSVCMLVVLILLSQLSINVVLLLFIKIFAGALSYFICSLIIKHPIIYIVKDTILKKGKEVI